MKCWSGSTLISLLILALLLSTGSAQAQKNSPHQNIDADVLFANATQSLSQGMWDESIASFGRAIGKYRKSENNRKIIGCYLGMAVCYSLKGNYKKSLKINNKALALCNRESEAHGCAEQILRNRVICARFFQTSKLKMTKN